MNPFLVLALFCIAFVADIVLSVYLGGLLGRALWRLRIQHANSLFVRIVTHCALYAVLSVILVCVAVLTAPIWPLLGLALCGPFWGAAVVADYLTPDA